VLVVFGQAMYVRLLLFAMAFFQSIFLLVILKVSSIKELRGALKIKRRVKGRENFPRKTSTSSLMPIKSL